MALHQKLEARQTTIPAPLIINPIQQWDGIDGIWSTFSARLGTPPQSVRLLISTKGWQTEVNGPTSCTNLPSNCSDARGKLFDLSKSSSWQNFNGSKNVDGSNNFNFYSLASGGQFPPSPLATYGFDSVGLGETDAKGPTLDGQVVAEINVQDKSHYLGTFGISYLGTKVGSGSRPSFLRTLLDKNLIPSLSWGYAVGANYRLKQSVGSLIFGGYDTSLFTNNSLTFSMAAAGERMLLVSLRSIILSESSTSNTTSLLPSAVFSLVDSAIPGIWLPPAACSAFEAALGLTFDNATQLYLVNDDLHSNLTARNLNFTFYLGDDKKGDTIRIVLPYDSFDQMASPPFLTNNSTKPMRYFPLFRAQNDQQYTLGRVFLQEAYIIANYERRTFFVYQRVFDPLAQSLVIPIPPINATYSNNTIALSSPPSDNSSRSLAAGAIAGITVAIVIIFLILVIVVAFFSRRWPFRIHEALEKESEPLEDPPEPNEFFEEPPPPLISPDGAVAEPSSYFALDKPAARRPIGADRHAEMESPSPRIGSTLFSPVSGMSSPSELPSPRPAHELPGDDLNYPQLKGDESRSYNVLRRGSKKSTQSGKSSLSLSKTE
ncbi:MAG: hypothetical protein M1829_006540 [Trizodia sp. TS-e1964]|nr:MAG: hypothetical protein M1829_006540 [Trizodia sp. TS-e1964]